MKMRISAMLCFLLLSAAGVFAQDTKEYEARKARLETEISIIDRQLAENASRTNSLLSDLTLLRKNIANRKALVAESDRQIKKLNDQIYLTQKQINKLQARVDTLSSRYSRLVVNAYKNRDARVWYMYLFASENIGQAFRRLGYFRNLSSQLNAEAAPGCCSAPPSPHRCTARGSADPAGSCSHRCLRRAGSERGFSGLMVR